jgi:hypothetical protein
MTFTFERLNYDGWLDLQKSYERENLAGTKVNAEYCYIKRYVTLFHKVAKLDP